MTTTQPPLKPGDIVLIEAKAMEIDGHLELRILTSTGVPSLASADWYAPNDNLRWHLMPGPTSPEAAASAHIAELERLQNGLTERGFPPVWTADTDALAAVDTLRQGRDAARAELDRTRPVVAAALALDAAADAVALAPGEWMHAMHGFTNAVDAYRADQNAPASPPQATQGHEKAEDGPSDGLTPEEAHKTFDGVDELNDDPEPIELLTHHDEFVASTVRLTVVDHPARPLQVDLRRDSEPHPCCIARIPRAAATQLAWDILTTYDPDGAPFDEAARLAHQAMRREMDHLERCLARLGVPFCTPFDVDHPTPVEAALIEIERLRNLAGGDASTWSPAQPGETPGQVEPDDALPQPTDAPAQRDWAGEIAAAIEDATKRSIEDPNPKFTGWAAIADHIVAALRLHDLEDGAEVRGAQVQRLRDKLVGLKVDRDNERVWRERAERERDTGRHVALALRRERIEAAVAERDEARRERDEARAVLGKWCEYGYAAGQLWALREGLTARNWIPVQGDEVPSALRMIDDYTALALANDQGLAKLRTERDVAVGKLDALRAGVRAEADKLIANPACYMGCHRIMHIVGSRIRALLAADTSTPDGTTTAETDGAV